MVQVEMTGARARTVGTEMLRGVPKGGVVAAGKVDSRQVPVLPRFSPPVPGRADEAQGLSGPAHQLHPQEHEDGQVPWLGGSLSGESPARPGPGTGSFEDIRPPLLCVPGVLPGVHVPGAFTLVSQQGMGQGRGTEGHGAPGSHSLSRQTTPSILLHPSRMLPSLRGSCFLPSGLISQILALNLAVASEVCRSESSKHLELLLLLVRGIGGVCKRLQSRNPKFIVAPQRNAIANKPAMMTHRYR